MIPHVNSQDQYQRPKFFIPSTQTHQVQPVQHSPPNIQPTFLNPMPQQTADIHTTLQQTVATASWVLGQQTFMQPQQQAIMSKWISWPIMTLRPYFQVTNSYVLKKIGIMIFPFRHNTWQRIQTTTSPTNASSLSMPGSIAVYSSGSDGGLTCVPVLYALPKEDINAPDLYIPSMAFVTYVILVGIIYGMGGKFKPDMLGLTASSALIFSFLELLIIKLGCYLLSFGNELAFLDVMSYVGYKYIGLVCSLIAGIMYPRIGSLIVWLYAGLAFSLFLLRSLRHAILPDSSSSGFYYEEQRRRRIHFLLVIAFIQMIFSYFLIVNPEIQETSQ